MSRCVPGLSRWLASAVLLCPLLAAAPAFAVAAAPVAITYAELPVRLVRDTGMYSAGRGTALQANDLIDAGKAAIQIGLAGSTVALGPDSQLFIRSAGDLVLLKGWLKVYGAALRGPRLSTGAIELDSTGATVTLHVAPDVSALFAESGDLAVTELASSKRQRVAKVPREQFAVKHGDAPLKLAAHPPKDFLAGMPRVFLDTLVPVAVNGPALPPKYERRATFADVAPWLAAHPALHRQLQRRFNPALSKPH